MKKNYINFLLLTFVMALALTGCHYNIDNDIDADPHCCAPPPPPPPPSPPTPPCIMGYDGIAGQAFLSLDYNVVPPTYIWGNNSAIPGYFTFGSYYFSHPGSFDLYYEGAFIEGCCLKEYYWDVEYVLWINPGSNGGCGFNGVNGADSFAKIFMDPYGPDLGRINKMEDSFDEFKVIEHSADRVVLENEIGGVVMRTTYTRLDESKKAELQAKNASGELKAAAAKAVENKN